MAALEPRGRRAPRGEAVNVGQARGSPELADRLRRKG